MTFTWLGSYWAFRMLLMFPYIMGRYLELLHGNISSFSCYNVIDTFCTSNQNDNQFPNLFKIPHPHKFGYLVTQFKGQDYHEQ
jgi:hypothetical protein